MTRVQTFYGFHKSLTYMLQKSLYLLLLRFFDHPPPYKMKV